MDLILWRHAEAVDLGDGQSDLERELTPHGRKLLAFGTHPRIANLLVRAQAGERALACDTAALLAQYVPAFDKRFLGLYGDAQATAKVAKEFKVFYQKVPGSTPGTYSMDHTAGSYVFDPKGRLRLFVKHGQGAAPLVTDLGRLLDGA